MINLFENFNTDSADFLRSQIIAGFKIRTVVINDDGFLPKEVDSPVKYYCQFTDQNKPLYFDRVPLPKFWRIDANANGGDVYDLDQKRAEINFTGHDNQRNVKQVKWLDRNGHISWIDHYNLNGRKFAQTFFDQDQAVLKKYFAASGKTVIVQYLASGDIFLHWHNRDLHFSSLVDFVLHYLQERKYKLDHIFYNTLNLPFFIDLKLKTKGTDTLFWQENTGQALPGNMQYLVDHATRTKHIVFQRYNDWLASQRLLPAKPQNVDFQYLGMIYPHPRGNRLRMNALILTNSDQIEHLTEVVRSMNQIHFNIAAITEMSDKLLAFNQYTNVDLYPNVTTKKVKELLDNCDLYFDINHGNEILDAVRMAFEQNMLIVGFNNTLHQPRYIASENIFQPNEVNKMTQKVMSAINNVDVMQGQIDLQRVLAGDVAIKDYKEVLGKLIK